MYPFSIPWKHQKTDVYRKTDGLEVDCYVLLLFKSDVKRCFNLSHVTKESAKRFARGCKRRIHLGKTLYRFCLKKLN